MIKQYKGVVLCDLPAQVRNQLMKYCYQESVRTYVTPKISDILLCGADDIHLFDTPLLLSRNQGLSINQRFVKRICDIVVALIGIVFASPFMLFIALAIKLYDGGPILYKQERLTRDEKPFMIYKFRSMSVDSETKGARLAAKGDKRATPVGRIIRNIHFDELPQLFNILKGDMSIVGNRPLPLYEAELLTSDEHIDRFMGPAGLTGLWQVEKRGGAGKLSAEERKQLDITYAKTFSFWLDIKIILKTVTAFIQKENV